MKNPKLTAKFIETAVQEILVQVDKYDNGISLRDTMVTLIRKSVEQHVNAAWDDGFQTGCREVVSDADEVEFEFEGEPEERDDDDDVSDER